MFHSANGCLLGEAATRKPHRAKRLPLPATKKFECVKNSADGEPGEPGRRSPAAATIVVGRAEKPDRALDGGAALGYLLGRTLGALWREAPGGPTIPIAIVDP